MSAFATLYFGTNAAQRYRFDEKLESRKENYLQTGDLPLGYASLR
jgi:hypothetical protein